LTSYSDAVDAEKISERTRRNQREMLDRLLASVRNSLTEELGCLGTLVVDLLLVGRGKSRGIRPHTFTLSAMRMRDGITHNGQHDSPTRSPRMHPPWMPRRTEARVSEPK